MVEEVQVFLQDLNGNLQEMQRAMRNTLSVMQMKETLGHLWIEAFWKETLMV